MGKNRLMPHLAAILAIMLFGFLAIGSATTRQSIPKKSVVGEETIVSSVTTSKGGVNNTVRPHEKSYETLGLVFATTVTEFDEKGQPVSSQEGIVTMLLREAHKLGADDILNLRIDENTTIIQTTSETTTESGSSTETTKKSSVKKVVTYTGSALAIRYNDKDVPSSGEPFGHFVPGTITIQGKIE